MRGHDTVPGSHDSLARKAVSESDARLEVPGIGREFVIPAIAKSSAFTGKLQGAPVTPDRRVWNVRIEPGHAVPYLHPGRREIVTYSQIQGQARRQFDVVLRPPSIVAEPRSN